jgi:peptidoglycan hydrolase-like protein with peptidoglycan-binding domain
MNSEPTLSIGSTGPDVQRLQFKLVTAKLPDDSGIDGIFGSKTQDAVKSSNKEKILRRTVVGPMTWNALPADPQMPG